MTKRNKTFALLLTAAMLGVGATASVAASPWGGADKHGCAHGEKRGLHGIFKKLNLSEQQRDQLFEIRHSQRPALREKMKELRKSRGALRELALAETYDAAQVKKAADEQARIQADLTMMRTETMHKMMEILTPEQKQQLAELRSQRGHYKQ